MARTIQCRAHGGTFTIVPRRGRPPVRCGKQANGIEYAACSRAGVDQPAKVSRVEATASAIKNKRAAEIAKLTAERHPEIVQQPTAPRLPRAAVERPSNPSLPLAMAAKERLEALGWVCTGKGSGTTAELTASRDEELLIIVWTDGELVTQDYILWDVDRPHKNDMPTNKLSFDPDECTDSELVRALSGMRVTWWNKLGQSEETGIISPGKIQVEHSYAGNGDETPGDRIIKFIDHGGSGFRAFRVAALIKVG